MKIHICLKYLNYAVVQYKCKNVLLMVFFKFDMKYILFSIIKGIFFTRSLKIDNNLNNIFLDILLMNQIGLKSLRLL